MNRTARFALMIGFLLSVGGVLPPALAGDELATAASLGANIARGKPYRLAPAPNYRLCTDDGDTRQLTDGERTDQYFWTQPGTVGWQHVPYATVTVDLERVEPIGGVAMTTAAGVAGVTWPMAVVILVSDDGKAWHEAGDLVTRDLESHGAWPEGYAIRRMWTDQLRARGRYVQFVLIPLAGGPYLFVDEVEVLRGPEALLDVAPASAPTTAEGVYEQGRLARSVRHRWDEDLAALQRAIEGSGLSDEQQTPLSQRWEQLRTAGPDPVAADPSFRAVLPLGPRHEQLFQIQAALWQAMGHPGRTAWVAASPWDPLDPFAPPAAAGGELMVDAMRGETRAAAVNLANSTDQPLSVRLRFENLPGGPLPSCVRVHEVLWTDTSQGTPVAAALPEARRAADGWRLTVLPGLVQQVWFSFRFAADDPPGRQEGTLSIAFQAAGEDAADRELQQDTFKLPVRLHVRPLDMPGRTSLRLGGWCYTDATSRYGVTPANYDAFLQHLQQRHVNAPWATAGVLMSFEFDAQDPGQIRLDTAALDRWLDRWPDAQVYMVFLSVAHYSGAIRSSLGGAEIDSPQFQQRVGTWISAWVRHLAARGIEPGRLALLIHDEPHEGADLGPLLAWARAIRAAEPEVIIWEDPTYRDPAAAPPELFEACDVLCPNRPMWLERGQGFADFYRGQQQQGRSLQFYSCSGPAKLLDPYSYHRLQAWHSWQVGGTGSFFWAFGDSGGASSWNEYYAHSGPYTPLFLDETTVVAGKHMEAIAESAQDYEYLVMLRAALKRAATAGRSGPAVARAQAVVESAAERVLQAAGASDLKWHEPKDRRVADQVRTEILDALADLAAGGGSLVDVRRIWDQAPHNAFTDLVRFQDRWYCVFREGAGHVSPDGALRVITSADGEQWESAALLTSEHSDLRDAKITVTSDGRLMLSGAEAVPPPAEYKHQSLTWFSPDGRDWSPRHEVGDRDFWLWRTTWHQDTAYGFGYGTRSDQQFLRLYTSRDGSQFQTLVDRAFDEGYPNETAMVFEPDETCYCLLRRDGRPNTAQLGIARPPYTQWIWRDLGVQIGGPHMIRLPDGRLVAAVRRYDGGARTGLHWLDPEAGRLTEFLQLPSGGDTSYPGLVWHDGLLWVSYYSSHEEKTCIYLARVKLDPAPESLEAGSGTD